MPDSTNSESPRTGVVVPFLERLGILYFVLYFLPFPLTVLAQLPAPFTPVGRIVGLAAGFYTRSWNTTSIWVGEHVLRLGPGAVIIQPTGSGDTLAQYIKALCLIVVATAGAIGWTIARGRRGVSPRVSATFHVYLRYALSMWLLTYGFAKVPPQQFTMPGADLLLRTYGDSSPMGLLWTFMGFSPAYTMFAGLAELLPGFLLLFRRTATLGALVGTATMLNVVVLNFCYDVPVKLFSAHLLAALVVIALPDVPRLVNLFVLNRPVAARPALNLPWWQNVTMLALKSAYLLLFLGTSFYGAYGAWQGYRTVSAPPPLAGIYDVDVFASNGTPRPANPADRTRWLRFSLGLNRATVFWNGGGHDRFTWRRDDAAGTLTLTRLGSTTSYVMTLSQPSADRIVLEGTFAEEPIRVELARAPARDFAIAGRGFHWIQEQPFNR